MTPTFLPLIVWCYEFFSSVKNVILLVLFEYTFINFYSHCYSFIGMFFILCPNKNIYVYIDFSSLFVIPPPCSVFQAANGFMKTRGWRWNLETLFITGYMSLSMAWGALRLTSGRPIKMGPLQDYGDVCSRLGVHNSTTHRSFSYIYIIIIRVISYLAHQYCE